MRGYVGFSQIFIRKRDNDLEGNSVFSSAFTEVIYSASSRYMIHCKQI